MEHQVNSGWCAEAILDSGKRLAALSLLLCLERLAADRFLKLRRGPTELRPVPGSTRIHMSV